MSTGIDKESDASGRWRRPLEGHESGLAKDALSWALIDESG